MSKKIALALGGGGFKGYTHIGVIRQLQIAGYEISAISGTSAGGIIGSLFAFGYSIDEIERFIIEINQKDIFNHLPGDSPSILGLGGLYNFLEDKFGEHTFEDLIIPFNCTAVDMKTGQEVIIDCGKIIDALQATIAVPGIFPSKVIGPFHLVDGGVLDPVPVAAVRWIARNAPIIAICLSPAEENWNNLPSFNMPSYTPLPSVLVDTIFQMRLGRAMRVFIDSVNMMSNWVSELRLSKDQPDFILRPEVYQISMFDMVDPKEMIMKGEKIVKEKLKEISTIFSTSKGIKRWLRSARSPDVLLSQILEIYNKSPALNINK